MYVRTADISLGKMAFNLIHLFDKFLVFLAQNLYLFYQLFDLTLIVSCSLRLQLRTKQVFVRFILFRRGIISAYFVIVVSLVRHF